MVELVTGQTVVNKNGKLIACPRCYAQDRVYHFNWVTLVCNACKSKVPKLEWRATTYHKKPAMTIDRAIHWFGDRGMVVAKSNLKIRGKWALVRYHPYMSVDCYDVTSGSLCAESWDCIAYNDSPFVPFNEERTEIALARLEEDYSESETTIPDEYQDDGKIMELCLIERDDSSKEVLPFRPEHNGLVKTFLEAQLAFSLASTFPIDYDGPELQVMIEAKNDAGDALWDAGVFHHKYHKRTTWELANMGEVFECEQYHPFHVAYPKSTTKYDDREDHWTPSMWLERNGASGSLT